MGNILGMGVGADFYHYLLAANAAAFSQHLFKVAYHMLAAALYYAVELQDAGKVAEVEQLAQDQQHELKEQFRELAFERQPCEVGLYGGLTKLAQSRRLLLAPPVK